MSIKTKICLVNVFCAKGDTDTDELHAEDIAQVISAKDRG